MYVDPKTLLFEKLTEQEKTELIRLAEAIMFHDTMRIHPLLQEWVRVCVPDPTMRLVMVATVFPARALLSVVRSDRPTYDRWGKIDLERPSEKS